MCVRANIRCRLTSRPASSRSGSADAARRRSWRPAQSATIRSTITSPGNPQHDIGPDFHRHDTSRWLMSLRPLPAGQNAFQSPRAQTSAPKRCRRMIQVSPIDPPAGSTALAAPADVNRNDGGPACHHAARHPPRERFTGHCLLFQQGGGRRRWFFAQFPPSQGGTGQVLPSPTSGRGLAAALGPAAFRLEDRRSA